MSETYNVDWFIRKFSAIPDELWVVGGGRGANGKCGCALTHCGETEWTQDNPERFALSAILGRDEFHHEAVTNINDGHDQRYKQKTPKARILAALDDIKAKEAK